MVDEQNDIMIIDFGLCLRIPFEDPSNRSAVTDVSANTSRRLIKTQGQCGRLEYMAPEIASRSNFDGFAIDLWAAGIVLFELLVGKKPFTISDPVDSNFQAISVEGNLAGLLRAKGKELHDSAAELLQGMLWRDPAMRLTLSQIVHHPWLQGLHEEGGTIAVSTEGTTVDTRWFINNKSLDDVDDTNANFLLTGSLDLCSTMDSDASLDAPTSVSSEAASSDMASQKQLSKSDYQRESEFYTLSKCSTSKKRYWWVLSFKRLKLWITRKAASQM